MWNLDGSSWVVRQQLQSFIFPNYSGYNCSNSLDASIHGPSVGEFLSNLLTYQLVLLIVGLLLTIFSFVIALLECIYIYRNISSEKRRNKLYFLITLFPISIFLMLVGMISPRNGALMMSGGMLYFLLCLFILVSLIRHLTDGRNQLSRELTISGRNINFQSPPICCFFSCLPEVKASTKNLKILEFFVLQAPIVRAVVLFIEATITVEIQRDAAYEVQLCEFATLISILLAVFAIHTLARLVSDRLSIFGFMWMFRIVDIAMLFFSAQHPILFQNILLRFNLIGCGGILTPPEHARFICNFIVICELFFLSVLTLLIKSPERSSHLFGKESRTVTEEQSLTQDVQEDANLNPQLIPLLDSPTQTTRYVNDETWIL
ncbi:Protein C18A3.4, isoform b [Aphelenchoides besseyi]|nr:Protein C18A3.4, isoform b [Aphelenchoides besseyi]